MKLIHLSDLHIGKRVNEFSMLEDQKYILAQILAIIQKECADGVILAGDIYDKAVPPAEAVLVFDRFLTQLANWNCPVFIISGNHDSAERLAFGAQLMSRTGIYFSPVYDGTVRKIVQKDAFGEVAIHLLPFVKPATVRHGLDADVYTYQEALRAVIEKMEICPEQRNILVAHQFVTGASCCDSEDVSVGGVDQIEAELFDAFDYVALGHLHSPQHVKRQEIRYCGTPLKYSFSESEQEKSVTVVELKEKSDIQIRTIPLKPLRDMRKIRGTYLEVTARSFYEHTNTEDYVQITLTDEEDIPDGLQKLRTIYPNLMRLDYDNKRTRENRIVEAAEEMEQKTETELFGEFFAYQNNQEMSVIQQQFVEQLMEDLKEDQK